MVLCCPGGDTHAPNGGETRSPAAATGRKPRTPVCHNDRLGTRCASDSRARKHGEPSRLSTHGKHAHPA
eukprot:3822086-Alexandrium_andersonii.AAC.1